MKPNILILQTDQQRYDSLGCYGAPKGCTPHLDLFAADACVFDRHIVANPVCQPSRASFHTGLYPQANGVWANGMPLNSSEWMKVNAQPAGSENGIPVFVEPKTMADLFREQGYNTAAFGKLHLTPNRAPEEFGYPETWEIMKQPDYDRWTGPYYGFQHVELTLGHGEQVCEGGHYGLWLQRNHPEVAKAVREHQREGSIIPEIPDLYPSPVPAKLHNNAWLADRASDWIREKSAENDPFFLVVGFPDPHHPFTPSEDRLKEMEGLDLPPPCSSENENDPWTPLGLLDHCRYNLSADQWVTIRQYTAAMIHQVDEAVGSILQTLRDAGEWENTLILFTSDHGDYLGDRGLLRKGYSADRPLVHVPFILRAPNAQLPARWSGTMSNVDVMPTLLDYANLPIPDTCQGRSVLQVQEGFEEYAFTYCHTGNPRHANATVFDKQYRLSWYPTQDRCLLFDHEQDPHERCDLSENPDQKDRIVVMKNILKDHMCRCAHPVGGQICAW